MTRMMKPNPQAAPYFEEVRADKHTLQSGTTNDPVLQSGVLYLNAEKSVYIYYDGNALKWHPPTSFEVTIG